MFEVISRHTSSWRNSECLHCLTINVSDYPTLENCLFGALKLTKNADINKYGYYGYRIGFGRHGSFSFPGTGFGRNVIIFGVDMSSSTKMITEKSIF